MRDSEPHKLPKQLGEILVAVQRRLKLQAAIGMLALGAGVGGCVLLALELGRIVSGGTAAIEVRFFIGCLLTSGFAAVGYLRKIPLDRCAKRIDESCGLQDRIVTALQFSRLSAPNVFHQLQLDDANRRLQSVSGADVVPFRLPKHLRWVAASIAAASMGMLCPTWTPQAIATPPETADISNTVEEAEKAVVQMEEIARATGMEDLEDLAIELRRDISELQVSDPDIRNAMKMVSRMQNKIKALSTAMDVGKVDAQLREVSDAMANADAFRKVSDALKKEDLSAAADALESADTTDMDRAQARPTSEKLAEAANSAKDRGLQKTGQTLEELADSVQHGDSKKAAESSKELARQVRQQDVRKQVSQLLSSKAEALGQSKRLLSANSNRSGNGNAQGKGLNTTKGKSNQKATGPSQKAGSRSAGNIDGRKTELESYRQMAKLSGKLTGDGESEFESETTESSDQRATLQARQTFNEYQKLSDAVLDTESIPLGHRETIRRYFQLIRPTSVDGQTPKADSFSEN